MHKQVSFEECLKHALVWEYTSFPVSRVFQACACGECTSFPVVNTRGLPPREYFQHVLVVNTQAFRSVEFFPACAVANAQAKVQFEECFRHSLVSECISRNPSERSFSHALVADTRAKLEF